MSDDREQLAARVASSFGRVRRTRAVLGDVAIERVHQRHKYGDQDHLPDGTDPDCPSSTLAALQLSVKAARANLRYQVEQGTVTFRDILVCEVAEAFDEVDPVRLRAELIQVAAVAVQWVEAIDARQAVARG